GVDNAVGIVGVAPEVATVRLVSQWRKQNPTASYIAEAITKAITTPPLPNVLLIEAQLGVLMLPPETDDTVLIAIRLAVASGVIVVETAGNGSQNLDSWIDSKGILRLNRNTSIFQENDSGAILVGAGTSYVPHERSIWKIGGSNFGSRIDCYAWGDSIVTCGKGNLGGSGNTSYTDDFGGTSGAAAIIAGCALLVQGLHFAKKSSLLSPSEMREMLSYKKTGTAQGVNVAGHIGVMPDLRAVVKRAKLAPNIFIEILTFRSWRRIRSRKARVLARQKID
ncbi:MAG TPA: S8 family serine peptidase, partial [Pyrinomonadaceae bacterium]|nr:S8 family serine peptidase [Pyrinomonadaceae bacterium]